jgi:hypothetical protein
MRNNDEYLLCRAISSYLKWKHPDLLFKFDVTGLNLSMAQAGMNKAIQKRKGWPDLMIFEPVGMYHGLFIELKREGTKILNKSGGYATPHLAEQAECLAELALNGYYTAFATGYDSAIDVIEKYLKA